MISLEMRATLWLASEMSSRKNGTGVRLRTPMLLMSLEECIWPGENAGDTSNLVAKTGDFDGRCRKKRMARG